MSASIDIWQMLAGIAIFMLGMSFMEEALRSLAGRRFKLYLKKQTSGKLKAITGGAVFSGLLQSSSIVNLLVLSLAGAGVIQMQSALAVMMGSNVGSTFTNWIVATLGFSLNIETLAFPLTAIAGIALAFLPNERRLYQWAKFALGFSLLFIGLGFIKTGMADAVKHTDLSMFNDYPVVVFVLAGMIITALVQSSSTTVALVLSALYANAISLHVGMAVVLGAEIGTTFKLFLASAKGTAVKKRIALGNLMYNVITVIVILIVLQPLHDVITGSLAIQNELIALVLFQTFVNVASILLFLPFLDAFGHFLERRFTDNNEESLFIHKVNVSDTTIALEALEKEGRSLLYHVLDLSASAMSVKTDSKKARLHKDFSKKPVMDKYLYIKNLYGEIHGFYIRLQKLCEPGKETERLEQLVSSVRNSMYAAKNIKDALPDIDQMRNSSNDVKYNFYLDAQKKIGAFCEQAMSLLEKSENDNALEGLTTFYKETQASYTRSLQDLYKEGMEKHLSEEEISTLVNFNRETYTAFKSIIFSLKDLVLQTPEADKFDELPGFIR
jgi:phosphate:Na+ symporter